jgi:hypothetical protein
MKLDYVATFDNADGGVFLHTKLKLDGKRKPVKNPDYREVDGEGNMIHPNLRKPQFLTEEVELTLREVIIITTQTHLEKDSELSPLAIAEIGRAGIAAMRGQQLTSKQAEMIQERAAKTVLGENPILYAQICEALEGESEPEVRATPKRKR